MEDWKTEAEKRAERDAGIVECFNNGEPRKEIARRFGLSVRRVAQIRKAAEPGAPVRPSLKVRRQSRQDLKKWMTTKQVASYLGISVKTIQSMRQRGDGPPYSRPSHMIVRYRRQDVDEFMARHRRRSTSDPDPGAYECSFCDKSLTSSGVGVSVCDECVEACLDIIADGWLHGPQHDETLLNPREIKAPGPRGDVLRFLKRARSLPRKGE